MTTVTADIRPLRESRRLTKAVKIVVALIVVGALATLAVRARQHVASRTAPPFRFETTTVDRGPIRAKVTATGTVNPIVTVQVGAQVSGTIQALGADFNSVVKPGQMMAQIDPRLFKAAVQQAEANSL